MNEQERKNMLILADTLKGEINRMCVTKQLVELESMYGYAKNNLDKLYEMLWHIKYGGIQNEI